MYECIPDQNVSTKMNVFPKVKFHYFLNCIISGFSYLLEFYISKFEFLNFWKLLHLEFQNSVISVMELCYHNEIPLFQ